ncbi:hypothetical protein cyc_04258 [Cyclospora cayetanensis]|uniref:Uncharacterized protein n=1 Tax=Cyclospora cayetanensis TaxID=88456 RepID=A0A1D3CZS6_9EIME|nr:hypothetical protein cyc_04258 [Cyclospora cayetanensis]
MALTEATESPGPAATLKDAPVTSDGVTETAETAAGLEGGTKNSGETPKEGETKSHHYSGASNFSNKERMQRILERRRRAEQKIQEAHSACTLSHSTPLCILYVS